jgi:protein-S-isoprenylcysteine O-methyltransferase Ste14
VIAAYDGAMNPYLIASYWICGLWFASWMIAALWADRAARRPVLGAEFLYRIVTIAGAALMFAYIPNAPVLYRMGPVLAFPLIGIEISGFVFCWWARLHLGRLWSGSITRKAEHHVVDTGPYGLVRHPIYTGLDTAAICVALVSGQIRIMVGAVLLILGCWIKARLEERWLRQELGAEAYDAYAARVPMLVPFWPK